MIHHISIDAGNPRHVADVLAEIMGGQVFPAPPNFRPDSWFVFSGDEYGTMLEVLPSGTEMRPGEREAGFHAGDASGSPFIAVHAYISTELSGDELLRIGEREGWLARLCDRGPFELVEFWVENRLLIEFASPEMKAQYVGLLTNPEALQAATAELQMSE
ncbi:MAG TPA: hypothetical protein VFD58_04915 [Blastocatellia bacterium]|nr:hypothetical protein [Blastocatellia bacterium]